MFDVGIVKISDKIFAEATEITIEILKIDFRGHALTVLTGDAIIAADTSRNAGKGRRKKHDF